MKLDRTTYEAWLLDRAEGTLSPEQERLLDAFLAANPDLSAALGELPTVESDAVQFSLKDALRREVPPTGIPDSTRLTDFLIARAEGDLDPAQEQALQRFLYEHPEHEREAKLVDAARIGKDATSFEKTSIQRHFPPMGMPDRHRMDDFLIAKLEGELTLQQHAAVDALIASDASVAQAWALVQRTRTARGRIVFPDKEGLKKKQGRVIPLQRRVWTALAAAASIALVIGLGWSLLREDVQPGGIAEDPQKVEQVKPRSTPSTDTVKEVTPNEVTVPSATTDDLKSRETTGTSHEERSSAAEPPHLPVPAERQPAPALAEVQRPSLERGVEHQAPADVPVAQGVPPAPMEPTLADATTAPKHHTVGELLGDAVRREVLGRPEPTPRALDGADAVAALDKGLSAISGDRAGLDLKRGEARSRFNLRLGQLALSASASTRR